MASNELDMQLKKVAVSNKMGLKIKRIQETFP